ncbi:DUF1800 domain-containing protein [Pontibacter cellulosilyticus]|uniref:DUF1800 domain-containing protein n=1 Tax=Pontibacter cellulosilyticus TaxID=1720253 RepID=A0A923N856_9BACT|nr:DUF1800 domain-containing protein [Pontibacter cellulosilyticus]MBC5994528.1 DUF1800 domain-containing protein [Pontibacter cellulosilyticus]
MAIWNVTSAQHLLSRCLFGYTSRDITLALSYTKNDYVNKVLLAPVTAPAPPGNWINEEPALADSATRATRQKDLVNWWIQLMLQDNSLQEKMVLFWHNHFVSEMIKVAHPQHMYWQNHLFRTHAFGNFRTLTKAVTTNAAMLIYLDGISNTKNKPNENYARELLELFTLGIGNYTDTDVKEAARALTGWQVDKLRPFLNPGKFDNTSKTFLGKTENYNHDTLIDAIFKSPKTAEHICTKLYKEFICSKTDAPFIKQMATVLLDADYEIKPLLAFMLNSDHFYDTRFIGSKIKSPVDLLVGTLKAFEVSNPEYNYLADVLRLLQQNLFNPPNVRGWEGQRKWISSSTFPNRQALTDSYINGKRLNGQSIKFQIDGLAYARTYTSCNNAIVFVNEVSTQLVRYPLSANKKNLLLNILLEGTTPTEWSTNSPMAVTRLKNFFKALMRLPEYQLC